MTAKSRLTHEEVLAEGQSAGINPQILAVLRGLNGVTPEQLRAVMVGMMPTRQRPGWVLIYRASKTTPDGRRIYARDYGLKAWPLWIRREKYVPEMDR